MVEFDIYAIAVEIDEHGATRDEAWFLSFDEAMENRMNYSNWWRPAGDVWITRRHNGPRVVEEWHIDEKGKIVSHYDWDKKKKG